MPYPARTPELIGLARRVSEIQFIHPLNEFEAAFCREIETCLTSKRRNVVLMPDAKTWAIRLCVGGTNHTLGLAQTNLENLIRFADMAIAYFWQYRTRCKYLEAEDNNLNISKERAQADLKNEPHAMERLKAIEAILRQEGYIRPEAEIAALKARGRKEPDRRTVGHSVLRLGEGLSKEIAAARQVTEDSQFVILKELRDLETRLTAQITELKDHIAKLTLVMTSVASNLSKE